MEIRFYTPEMMFIGLMENQRSLTWTRRYYEPGVFELHAPITQDNLNLTQLGNLVWMRGANEAAVIEDRTIEERWDLNSIILRGRMISSYTGRRLVRPTVTFNGLTEVAMRQLVSDAYPIPRVELGDMQGFTDTVRFQATYKNLQDVLTKLGRSANIGWRLQPDFDTKVITFVTYRGSDRSASQGVANRVIFSESYNNLENFSYRENDQVYKNVMYIGGEGEGSDRVIVQRGDATGLDRREVFIDARDLTHEAGVSDAEYREILMERGAEKEGDYQISETIECDTGADINFHYKVHYDLGDIVTVKKRSFGMAVDLRITEIKEIYERGVMKVSPVFGSPLAQTIDWSDIQ
ncbi:MAG: siphovirus ReqiPepy6 Gp37-like family protein [Clostridia bacterium]|nr:siphovirus ReqiPepy6 Gp37-like family protein [Clostridia bacterium]